jgi:hypothetical protein
VWYNEAGHPRSSPSLLLRGEFKRNYRKKLPSEREGQENQKVEPDGHQLNVCNIAFFYMLVLLSFTVPA